MLVILFALLLVTGCGAAPLVEIQTAIATVGTMQASGQKAAEAAYLAEQEACAPPPEGDPCVVEVRVGWKPIKEASAALYVAYNVALATYQAAQASYMVTKTFDVVSVTNALAKLLAAADAWRFAITTHGGAQPSPAPTLALPATR